MASHPADPPYSFALRHGFCLHPAWHRPPEALGVSCWLLVTVGPFFCLSVSITGSSLALYWLFTGPFSALFLGTRTADPSRERLTTGTLTL